MRKGQAALEFLMSYGWAIFAMIAVIAALSFTGVLSPSNKMSARCVLPPGLFCEDISIYPDRAYIALHNGALDIQLVSVQIDDCAAMINKPLYSGEDMIVTLSGCAFGNRGNQIVEKISVNYSQIAGTKQYIGEVKGVLQ